MEWKMIKESGKNEDYFLKEFLKSSPFTLVPLQEGSEETLKTVFEVINQAPLEKFLNIIPSIIIEEELKSENIPCFSNFENGASRLNEILEFYQGGLNYEEIGSKLVNSVSQSARVKYGENHSKLALVLSTVHISETRPAIVRPTKWGSFLTRYSFTEKEELIKKFLLRDVAVISILSKALLEPVNYNTVVYFLSVSTKIRRKTNLKKIIEFILKDSKKEDCLSNINWAVEVN